MLHQKNSVMSLEPWKQVQRKLFSVVLLSGLIALGAAAAFIWIIDVYTSRDIAAGVMIALLPQAWFVSRGFGRANGGQSASLALGKYMLSGAGFALWFALMPQAGFIATLSGAAATMVLLAVLTVALTRD